MSSLTEAGSCLNNVMDIMNPTHLLVHVGLPAVAGAVASRFVGTYQPDPNVPARSFSPITAAVYSGLNSVITKLALDGLCRMSNHVSAKDVFDVFGAGTLFVVLGAGIGALSVKHIIARNTAEYMGGEKIDFTAASKITTAVACFC